MNIVKFQNIKLIHKNPLHFYTLTMKKTEKEIKETIPFITTKRIKYLRISSVQCLSSVHLLVTPWTAAHQASLSITNSQSLFKLVSIELVMPSNHLIFCHPFLLPSIFPSIRVFSNESVLCIR